MTTTAKHPLYRPQAEKLVAVYMAMAEKGYRPGAPSDGLGNIVEDSRPEDLTDEALRWARQFNDADEEHEHWVGCTSFSTMGAVALLVEAIRLLNGGSPGDPWAVKMIRLALAELGDAS